MTVRKGLVAELEELRDDVASIYYLFEELDAGGKDNCIGKGYAVASIDRLIEQARRDMAALDNVLTVSAKVGWAREIDEIEWNTQVNTLQSMLGPQEDSK